MHDEAVAAATVQPAALASVHLAHTLQVGPAAQVGKDAEIQAVQEYVGGEVLPKLQVPQFAIAV